jgi:hypothetical protein
MSSLHSSKHKNLVEILLSCSTTRHMSFNLSERNRESQTRKVAKKPSRRLPPYKVAVSAYGTRRAMHSVGVHASAPESPANWSHRADAAPQAPVQHSPAPRRAPTSAAMTPGSPPASLGAHNSTTASSTSDRSGSAVSGRRSGRTVKKRTAVQFSDEPDHAPSSRSREGKLLKLALARSIVETKLAPTAEVPLARVFYPTKEQFSNPIKYIAR